MNEPTGIRPYRETDTADVDEICVRTGAAGTDATGNYSTNDLLPDVYARPYLAFAPDLAFVVEHGGSVGGYVLGVASTREYVDWFAGTWAPRLAAKYPRAARPRSDERRVIRSAMDAERMIVPEVDEYPAHLHVDLLPELQGRGLGRELLERLFRELRTRGVPGVHLGLDPANTGARAFYHRLGFVELASSAPDETLLGMRLDDR